MKKLENKIYEEWLRELEFSLDKRRLREQPITVNKCIKGSCSEVGVGIFSQVTSNRV